MNLMNRFRKKPPESSLQASVKHLQKKWKRLERKRKLWKFYFYSFVVLPVFAVMLAVKALKTYVRIKLREIAENTQMDSVQKPPKDMG
ncbi:MAG: hypothetical protein HFG49_10550 [Lachnospiraceae bacterium]|jgi:hypothetical protein|nr:hypothetical protein [Lachnospiraceae bacterium]